MNVPGRRPAVLLAFLALVSAGCGQRDGEQGQPGQAPSEEAQGFHDALPPGEGVIAEADAFIAEKKIDRRWAGWRTRLPQPPTFKFTEGKQVVWTLDTNQGAMLFRLRHDVAPIHVSSVVYLSRLKFYDGLHFHRVIRGFMAQGGDPLGNGAGMPGYSLPLEVRDGVNHDRPGVLSTANSGRPHSDGSQFFIMFAARPQLDGGYSIFGDMLDGLDTLRRIEALGAPRDPGIPRERIVIKTARVEVR